MTNEQIKAFALEHHSEMVEKGFWQDKSVVKKALLIAGELAEALEAHRKNNRCSIAISIFENKNFENELIRTKFEKEVKDTFEDEIADTMLRILDYYIGFHKEANIDYTTAFFEKVLSYVTNEIKDLKHYYQASDLDALLMVANKAALDLKPLRVFICLEKIAILINFDLWEHVKAKRKYNATRPFMFGKKY